MQRRPWPETTMDCGSRIQGIRPVEASFLPEVISARWSGTDALKSPLAASPTPWPASGAAIDNQDKPVAPGYAAKWSQPAKGSRVAILRQHCACDHLTAWSVWLAGGPALEPWSKAGCLHPGRGGRCRHGLLVAGLEGSGYCGLRAAEPASHEATNAEPIACTTSGFIWRRVVRIYVHRRRRSAVNPG